MSSVVSIALGQDALLLLRSADFLPQLQVVCRKGACKQHFPLLLLRQQEFIEMAELHVGRNVCIYFGQAKALPMFVCHTTLNTFDEILHVQKFSLKSEALLLVTQNVFTKLIVG